jgi:hypothetical protein
MLNVTDRTVRTHLKSPPRERKKPVRRSKVAEHKAVIDEVQEGNPHYNSELLFERLLRLGYTGKKSILKNYVAGWRPGGYRCSASCRHKAFAIVGLRLRRITAVRYVPLCRLAYTV